MRLRLQNIGIIEEADININGITVIAGKNDSGKSTVGKILYALTRALNIDEKSFNFSKLEFVQSRLNDIRNLILRAKIANKTDEQIRSNFVDNFLTSESIFSHFYRHGDELPTEQVQLILSNINELFINFSNESFKSQLTTFINDIEERLNISRDSSQVIQFELETYLESEFGNQIKNTFNKEKSFIEIELGLQKHRINIDKRLTIESNINQYSDLFYHDVFFIETPLDLNNKRLLYVRNSMLRNKKNYLNYKIYQPKEEQDIFSDTSFVVDKLNKAISEVIKGDFGFNSRNLLVFKKENTEFELSNVATGIKSFGIIQMLMENAVLNSNSLLIIDEPEVHLHPNWQVKYAEILVRLSKEFAIPILLTSHSPYFIEALEVYSKKYNYQDLTNYYYTQKESNGLSSKIVNTSGDINHILMSLTDAYYLIKDVENESDNS